MRLRVLAAYLSLCGWVRWVMRELRVWRQVLADARTPMLAKVLLWLGIGYALIPFDFIPVLGPLNDLLLAAVPIAVGMWLVPAEVLRDYRAREPREPSGL